MKGTGSFALGQDGRSGLAELGPQRPQAPQFGQPVSPHDDLTPQADQAELAGKFMAVAQFEALADAQPATDAGGKAVPPGSQEGKPEAAPSQPAEAAAPVHEEAADPSIGTPAGDAQEPPGTSESSATRSDRPRSVQRRGGAAEKLERALQAVLAHNQAQTAREKKWAVTESALARLTGCFRPAVRAFFAQRAEEIEAHNFQHHLVPGLNAARGKRGDQIEREVRWRERGTEAPPQLGGDDEEQRAGDGHEAMVEDETADER